MYLFPPEYKKSRRLPQKDVRTTTAVLPHPTKHHTTPHHTTTNISVNKQMSRQLPSSRRAGGPQQDVHLWPRPIPFHPIPSTHPRLKRIPQASTLRRCRSYPGLAPATTIPSPRPSAPDKGQQPRPPASSPPVLCFRQPVSPHATPSPSAPALGWPSFALPNPTITPTANTPQKSWPPK